MERLSYAFGRILDGLMLVACLLLLAMSAMIGADVVTRNIGLGGIAWSGEVSENIIYLLTLLSAPWLLRQGQHIRVDILLRALPGRAAWLLEWAGDILGLACSLYFVWYGWAVLAASYQAGAITIKTLDHPRVVDAGAAAGGLPALGRRVPVPHAPSRPRRAGAAHRCGVGVMTVRNGSGPSPLVSHAAGAGGEGSDPFGEGNPVAAVVRAGGHDVADGGAAAARRIDGAAADRHAGGAHLRRRQHRRARCCSSAARRDSPRWCATAWPR